MLLPSALLIPHSLVNIKIDLKITKNNDNSHPSVLEFINIILLCVVKVAKL